MLMSPIAESPATMVEAATISTTTFEKPSPMPRKKRFTSFIEPFMFFLRTSSEMKAQTKEKSVISTRPILTDLKQAQKKIVRMSGSTGKIAYQTGASVSSSSSFDSSIEPATTFPDSRSFLSSQRCQK